MEKGFWVRLIGAAIGLCAGVLILTIGFWKTFLLALLAFVGWWLACGRPLPDAIRGFIHKNDGPGDDV